MRFSSTYTFLAIALSWSASAAAQPAQPAQPANGEQVEGADRNDATMAASTDMQARAHFARGRELYDAGSFDEAAREFEAAYRLSGRTELLFNMYLSYRDSGELSRAVDALRRYLGEAGVVQDRAHLEARLRSMEEARARQVAEQQEEAARVEQEADARVAAAQSTAPARRPERKRSIVPFIVGGVGVAMLAAGTVTGLVALDGVNDLDDDCPDKTCPPGFDLDGERDSIRPLVIATDILLIGGAAAVGAAVVLYVLDSGKRSDEERPSAAPSGSAVCTSDGCSASVQVAF